MRVSGVLDIFLALLRVPHNRLSMGWGLACRTWGFFLWRQGWCFVSPGGTFHRWRSFCRLLRLGLGVVVGG